MDGPGSVVGPFAACAVAPLTKIAVVDRIAAVPASRGLRQECGVDRTGKCFRCFLMTHGAANVLKNR